MVTKEPEDSYELLSIKELQDLCKKYGLSPYNRRSDLVNSLISYFEVNVERNQFNLLHGFAIDKDDQIVHYRHLYLI